MNIDTSALLVELSISTWTARKLDKRVSQEVVASKNAGNRGAARVNKHLLAGRSELEVLSALASSARNYVAGLTMPWSDSGIRLLPAQLFEQVNTELHRRQAEFDEAVAEFVRVYPSLITAQAMALGEMFDRSEYPSAMEMASKFGFRFGYMPVPSTGDFRVDVGNDALKELNELNERIVKDRVERAMKEAWTRLQEKLQHLADRLQVDIVDGKEKPKTFHDTLLQSTFELVDVLKALNITNDPQLELARAQLQQAVSGTTADLLRNDLAKREDVQQKVNGILNAFQF
jgi:hypothetical protein